MSTEEDFLSLGSSSGSEESRAKMLDLVLLATMDALVQHNLGDGTVWYSDRWFLMLGFDPERRPAATPELWHELTHPDDLEKVEAEWQVHVTEGWPFQMCWRMRHGHGGYRWVECRSALENDEAGAGIRVVSVFSDVTERMAVGHRHLALIDAMPDTLLRLDMDGRVLDWRLGISKTASVLLGKVKVGERLVSTGVDAQWVIGLMDAATDALFQNVPQTLEKVLTVGKSTVCLETRVAPAGNSEVVCVLRDVTARRNLENRLQQAEKLEGIGQLAAGVAHEINTPLQFIGDNARFLKTALSRLTQLVESYRELVEETANDEQKKQLARVEKKAKLDFLQKNAPAAVASCIEGVERVGSIVAAMKEFSHPGSDEPTNLSVEHALRSSIKISTNEWKMCCTVDCESAKDVPNIRAFVGEIQQAFLNIIVNGAHALKDRYGDSVEGHIQCSIRAWGDGVEVEIADNGPGMPEVVRKRIFEPFFTTKEVGKGTGQGLAIAYRTVVERHGGELHCSTVEGEGTIFTIRLPNAPIVEAMNDEGALASTSSGSPAQLTNAAPECTPSVRLRALVADDEEVNRRVISAMLSKLGLDVSLAVDGIQAVEAWAGGAFDVIFMDLQMPRLCGLYATAEIRQLETKASRRSVAIVVVSGSKPVEQAPELDICGFLLKPCRLADLQACLEGVHRYRDLQKDSG